MNINISAKPARVFEALTNTDELTEWFAEKADISIEKKQYDFWGKYTPENPGRDEGVHTIESLAEGEMLSYKWRFRNADTLVDFKLVEDNGNTVLTLNHTGLQARGKGEFAMANFWSICLENLRAWIEKQRVATRCDFSTVSIGDVNLQIDIDAPGNKVFDALILPDQLDRYMGEGAEVEPVKGGKYSYGWGEGPVKILEIEENKRLSFSWKYKNEPDTVVTWELEGSGGKTRLTIVHSGFGDRLSDDYNIGWMEFLNIIKLMVETGPSWKKINIISEDYEDCV